MSYSNRTLQRKANFWDPCLLQKLTHVANKETQNWMLLQT
jgi:hypothetical protein